MTELDLIAWMVFVLAVVWWSRSRAFLAGYRAGQRDGWTACDQRYTRMMEEIEAEFSKPREG